MRPRVPLPLTKVEPRNRHGKVQLLRSRLAGGVDRLEHARLTKTCARPKQKGVQKKVGSVCSNTQALQCRARCACTKFAQRRSGSPQEELCTAQLRSRRCTLSSRPADSILSLVSVQVSSPYVYQKSRQKLIGVGNTETPTTNVLQPGTGRKASMDRISPSVCLRRSQSLLPRLSR